MNDLKQIYRKHLSEMCLKFPTYHTASPGERDRADYIERTFRSYGLKTRREAYPVRGWDFRSFSFRDVTTGKEIPQAVCEYFSGSVDFEGKLTVVTPDQVAEVETLELSGKVIFFTGSLGTFENGDFAEKLEALGAKAVIFTHTRPEIGAPHTKLVRSPYIRTIATCCVGPMGAAYLSANLDRTYRLTVDAAPYDTVSENIVGFVEGDSTKVVFGAHYDSAPNTQGAGDNASGTAILLEMSRLMKDRGCGHTMEFVAFTAEEYCERPQPGTWAGAKGSRTYVDMHKEENIACYINFDDYCHSPLFAPEKLYVGRIENLPGIRWPGEPNGPCLSSDDVNFYHAGFPVVHLGQLKSIRMLHTVHDDIDYIDFNAMAAVTGKYLDIAAQLLENL